jgi:hypothetical protein
MFLLRAGDPVTEEEQRSMLIEIKRDLYRYVDVMFERERQERAVTLTALRESQQSLASHTEFYLSIFIGLAGIAIALISMLSR